MHQPACVPGVGACFIVVSFEIITWERNRSPRKWAERLINERLKIEANYKQHTIADQLIRGNLIGYSKKEANRLLHRDGLQLPRRHTAVDFDTMSVAQDTDAVNNYSMQNSDIDAQGDFP